MWHYRLIWQDHVVSNMILVSQCLVTAKHIINNVNGDRRVISAIVVSIGCSKDCAIYTLHAITTSNGCSKDCATNTLHAITALNGCSKDCVTNTLHAITDSNGCSKDCATNTLHAITDSNGCSNDSPMYSLYANCCSVVLQPSCSSSHTVQHNHQENLKERLSLFQSLRTPFNNT